MLLNDFSQQSQQRMFPSASVVIRVVTEIGSSFVSHHVRPDLRNDLEFLENNGICSQQLAKLVDELLQLHNACRLNEGAKHVLPGARIQFSRSTRSCESIERVSGIVERIIRVTKREKRQVTSSFR